MSLAHFAELIQRCCYLMPFDKKLECLTNYQERRSFPWPLVVYIIGYAGKIRYLGELWALAAAPFLGMTVEAERWTSSVPTLLGRSLAGRPRVPRACL